jgi:signal transduction histidine kinase
MRIAAFILLFFWASSVAMAQSPSVFKTARTETGPVIEFIDGDYVLADGIVSLPESGWTRAKTPHIYRMQDTDWRTGDFHSLWGRFSFERAALGDTPIALYTVSTRNQFTVFVNGNEIFRNYASEGDQKNSWYRPFLIPLPESSLKPGRNDIAIRAISQDSVGIGRVVVGSHPPIQSLFSEQYFWRITLPTVANSAMLVLGGFAFLLWMGRRQESELLYFAITTLLWYLRNYQYFAGTTPFHLPLFNALTVAATYFTLVATFGFYGSYLKLPRTRWIVLALLVFGIPLHIIHWQFRLSNTYLYVPATMIALAIAIFGFRDFLRKPALGNALLFLVMFVIPMTGIYDFFLAVGGSGWNGNDSYISLFTGFLSSVAFLLTFGQRSVRAFAGLENANITLEQRIAETRAELAESEAARQQLVIGGAIATERERLMQEMHDGIGSNLITALAVARQQKQPASTIKTLRRALADLKITVDSLEPVEGDLVALIGNLRHRMAGDLSDAGITCKWNAQRCGPLPWLDATNALHVLRIFQEAIGNVLTHSGATEMRIGCMEEDHGGVPGIASYVADNGCGFDMNTPDTRGKGVSNIHARANSLHGALRYQTGAGSGTTVTLWLPYERTAR